MSPKKTMKRKEEDIKKTGMMFWINSTTTMEKKSCKEVELKTP